MIKKNDFVVVVEVFVLESPELNKGALRLNRLPPNPQQIYKIGNCRCNQTPAWLSMVRAVSEAVGRTLAERRRNTRPYAEPRSGIH